MRDAAERTSEPQPRGPEEVLQRLREQEVALDRQLEAARQRAQAILAEARAEAERFKEEAKVELAADLESLRQEAARKLEASLEAMQRELEQRIAALRRRAEANRERALAFLLLDVTGRATP